MPGDPAAGPRGPGRPARAGRGDGRRARSQGAALRLPGLRGRAARLSQGVDDPPRRGGRAGLLRAHLRVHARRRPAAASAAQRAGLTPLPSFAERRNPGRSVAFLAPEMARRPIITLMLAFLLTALLASPALASSSEMVTFEGSRDLLEDATWQSTLDEIDALGARGLRVILYWNDVAPSPNSANRPSFDATDPAAYPGFGKYDRLLEAAHAKGMKVVLTLSGPVPKWATAARKDNLTRPRASEFEKFAAAVGKRYENLVSWWTIWNEPNHPDFLLPQYSPKGHKPLSPGIYRQLFLSGWRGLRSTVGDPYLLMGETAPRGTGKVVAPLTFLRGALCLNSRYVKQRTCSNLPADGYAHHAYSTRQGPFFKPPGRNDVTIGVLGRLTSALDRAAASGAIKRGMGIYLTEFGVQSYPDKLLGVPLGQQAEFRSISEQIAWRNTRVRMFSQYLMRDSQ